MNSYAPDLSSGVLAFGLRGAQLANGHEVEKSAEVDIITTRPNHRDFRCVVGLYFINEAKLSVFTGSTVPCRAAVWGYANGGDASNLLPTGMHTMFIWRHKKLTPALRMGRSSTDPESGAPATVLRTTNDLTYGTRDKFDYSTPLDNVHCSYYRTYQPKYGAFFSSWGCITVRGRKSPSDQWKKFQEELSVIEAKRRVDLLLATGKELGLMLSTGLSDGQQHKALRALRRGSLGGTVEKLQTKIGMSQSDSDGQFGPRTLEFFTAFQKKFRKSNGSKPSADGVYSVSLEDETGWELFSDKPLSS